MEVKILKEQSPIIQINFEEIKKALVETLEEYEGIVVTEQSLNICKAKQKELASLRVKIDNYRKGKKKELSKPIQDFENQCKELISLIEQVEFPIKEGIKVFDDKKREEKRQQAVKIAKEVAEEYGLNEKYASRLEVLDKYCNLTAKASDVRDDLIARAMALKIEQDREQELIGIIKDTIASENERIKLKMKFEDFERYINMGMSAREVIAEIKQRANDIYLAENPPEPEPEPEEPEIVPEPEPEPIPEPETIDHILPEEQELYFAVYRITGTIEELRSVSRFLKDNNIQYSVIDQGEI